MPSFFSSLDTVPSVVDGVSEISFNVESHKLKEQFCSAFGLSLTSTDEEFKSFLLSCDLNESIRVGHHVLRTEEFDFIFGKFLSDLSLIFGSIAHQARPTFRIQKNGTRSVPFHTDDLSSGHPNQIINVWIPLVLLNESNTLHFVPKDKSRAIKQQFLDEKSSIDWITEESTRYSQP